MRLPTKRGSIDEERATRQICDAIDQGVNYIDTAVPYHGGESKRFIGRALLGGYGERVKLTTKLPPWSVKSRKDMDRILDIQLKKLLTDHIDYYLLHSLEAGQWKKLLDLGVLEFLDSAKAAGKIQNAGFSFHGDRQIFRDIIDAYPWFFCQIQYNFLWMRPTRPEPRDSCTQHRRISQSWLWNRCGAACWLGKLPKEVEQIYAQAGMKRSAAVWALRWVWNYPAVTVVLSGMNDEQHIAENLKTCEDAFPGSMTPDELATVEAMAGAYRRLMKVGCTGCGYCMPCPFGVNIPQCFSQYNDYSMGGNRLMTHGIYGMMLMGGMTGTPADASLCQSCGKCTKACPKEIAVPGKLNNVRSTLDGLRTRLLLPFGRLMFSSEVKE